MSNDETAVPDLWRLIAGNFSCERWDVEKLVEPEHCVRSIWELVGRLDLRLYYAQSRRWRAVPGESTPIRSC